MPLRYGQESENIKLLAEADEPGAMISGLIKSLKADS